jgi:hypothetical protein
MSRLGSWFRGPAKPTPLLPSLTPEDETAQLEDALALAAMIMNDDVDGADEKLKGKPSSFHALGRGITQFMRSVMGFEADVMREASIRLSESENTSWNDLKRAQREQGSYHGEIYSVGQEYALIHAESQLLSALVAVLNENLAESIKGFLKMRKAYAALATILDEEKRYFREKEASDPNFAYRSVSHSEKHMPGGFDENEFDESVPGSTSQSSANLAEAEERPLILDGTTNGGTPSTETDSDLEFVDADEARTGTQTTSNYLGHTVSNEQDLKKRIEDLSLNNVDTIKSATKSIHAQGPDAKHFVHPIDDFIHSGSNLCFGLLQLILYMMPPAFSKLLYIIGYKGDRERGIRMLWQATKFDNINGVVAAIVLLEFYNALLGFCDIVLTDEEDSDNDYMGYPRQKCEELLATMAQKYPASGLWRLQKARMASANRDMRTAIEILNNNQQSKMKQTQALNMFERCLTSMALHNFAMCSESFLRCTELNSWSHTLYYFVAGCAELELYRTLRIEDPETAAKHKEKATELIRKAPTCSGKKRFMAQQLPFDVYVVRKVKKWELRAKEWNVDLVDAVGVSPIEEMNYFWNGTRKMAPEDLAESLRMLEWSRATHPERFMSDLDEIAVQSVVKAVVLRHLERYEEARTILIQHILSHDK